MDEFDKGEIERQPTWWTVRATKYGTLAGAIYGQALGRFIWSGMHAVGPISVYVISIALGSVFVAISLYCIYRDEQENTTLSANPQP